MIGQRLGQYEITALLGAGGMATVYQATQISMRRNVAIKVIALSQSRNPDFIKRFEREAQTIASLSNAHILKVFDFGQQEDLIYLVMELLTGGNLGEMIEKQGMLPFPTATLILEQMASALDYAHQKGVVHRDLKPQNVLFDEAHNAYLTDFGIAKLLTGSTNLTQSGMVMGTPSYMSPEQWQGRAIDSRTDIYALGIMLYEMLSGILPFQGDTPYVMMHNHIYELPRSLLAVRPEVPLDVERVIEKSLAKDPENRQQTASELVSDFKAAMGTQPLPRLKKPAPKSHTTIITILPINPDATDVFDLPPKAQTAQPAPTPIAPAARGRSRRMTPILGVVALLLALGAVAVIIGIINKGTPGQPTANNGTTIALANGLNAATTTLTATVVPSTLSPAPTIILPTATVPTPTTPPTASDNLTVTQLARLLAAAQTNVMVSATAQIRLTAASILAAAQQPTNTPTIPTAMPKSSNTPIVPTSTSTIPSATPTIPTVTPTVPSVTPMPTSTPTVPSATPTLDIVLVVLTLDAHNTAAVRATDIAGTLTQIPLNLAAAQTASAAQTATATNWTAIPTSTPTALPATPTVTIIAPTVTIATVAPTKSVNGTVISVDNAAQLKEQRQIKGSSPTTLAYSQDGRWLAVSFNNNDLVIYDTQHLDSKPRVISTGVLFISLAFSPDGQLLVGGAAADGNLHLWGVAADKPQTSLTLRSTSNVLNSVAFSPDGKMIVTGSSDGIVRIYAVNTIVDAYSPTLYSTADNGVITTMAFSPDSKFLAYGLDNGLLRLMEMSSGKYDVRTFSGSPKSRVFSVAYSPDGASVAAASQDTSVRVYDVASASQRVVITTGNQLGSALAVAFSPDSKLIASGHGDHMVRVWRADKGGGAPLIMLKHNQSVSLVGFNPSGTLLTSGSADGTIRFWAVP